MKLFFLRFYQTFNALLALLDFLFDALDAAAFCVLLLEETLLLLVSFVFFVNRSKNLAFKSLVYTRLLPVVEATPLPPIVWGGLAIVSPFEPVD